LGRGLLSLLLLLLGLAKNPRHSGDESWKTETESERRDRFHTVRLDSDLASVEEVDDSVEVVLGVVRQDQLDPGAADQALMCVCVSLICVLCVTCSHFLAKSAKVWRGCSEHG